MMLRIPPMITQVYSPWLIFNSFFLILPHLIISQRPVKLSFAMSVAHVPLCFHCHHSIPFQILITWQWMLSGHLCFCPPLHSAYCCQVNVHCTTFLTEDSILSVVKRHVFQPGFPSEGCWGWWGYWADR